MKTLLKTAITLTAIGVAVRANIKTKELEKEIDTTKSIVSQLVSGAIKIN